MSELQLQPTPAMGGLDLVSPPQLISKVPGAAVKLENFEPMAEGGYRRIRGYGSYGELPDAYNSDPIRGIANYKGVVVVVGSTVLHSASNGSTWYVINKEGLKDAPVVDSSTVSLTDKPRKGNDPVRFQTYLKGTKEVLYITDDISRPAVLYYDEDNSSYQYYEIEDVGSGSDTTTLAGYRYVTKYKEHLVIASPIHKSGTIAISNTGKPEDFSTGNSLELNVTDEIIGLKTFRDYLYVFCRHSIYRVQNIEEHDKTFMLPVTTKVGCVDGRSIQEVGGDVLFLSDDGLRYLGATDRIDDVSINLVSAPVRPLADDISVLSGNISSVVLPEKAQYRLFYTSIQGERVGLIGTLTSEGRFVWSTTSDMNIDAITTSLLDETTGDYIVYHAGTHTGRHKVYRHDFTDTFDGTPFVATWSTPYFNMGSSDVRKTLHSISVYMEAKGNASIELTAKFNYNDDHTMQPEPFDMTPVINASRYNSSNYGSAIYGALRQPLETLFLEGSGKTIQLTFKDLGTRNTQYIIRGYDLQFTAGGRI